jgi:hypothetical protein
MNWKIVAIAVVILIVLSLPIILNLKSQKNKKDIAIQKCIEACKSATISGIDLSNGPCLLNPIPDLKDWFCDVVHNPTKQIDNLAENQYSSFREGKASHFVEVDPSCKFIRAY